MATSDILHSDLAWLENRVRNLESEVECTSTLLVRLLYSRDQHVARLNKQFDKLTAILKKLAQDSGMPYDLTFSLKPSLGEVEHRQWLNAWRVLARAGIPKHWRKTLWAVIAEHGTSSVDWNTLISVLFSETVTAEDVDLNSEIVKDLYRTGNTGLATEEEHGILKSVLLAYARYNKSTGYCQGFNIMAAMILRVVNFNEELALKVFVYIVDFVIPENYFAQNLYALSADIAVLKELLKYHCPKLSEHVEYLRQLEGTGRTSYSSEDPPMSHRPPTYEPPLFDVFTVQWFLTLFCISLPKPFVRKIWDIILLEGSEMLIYTALVIWGLLEKKLLVTNSASDFYSRMSEEKVIKPPDDFIQLIYATRDQLTASKAPSVQLLRDKYTYNVCPCAEPDYASEKKGAMCPLPTKGGAYGIMDKAGIHGSYSAVNTERIISDEFDSSSVSNHTLSEQVKLLQRRYRRAMEVPKSVTVELDLGIPMAKVSCPQTKSSILSGNCSAYAADVPQDMIQKYLTRELNMLDAVCETEPFSLRYS